MLFLLAQVSLSTNQLVVIDDTINFGNYTIVRIIKMISKNAHILIIAYYY